MFTFVYQCSRLSNDFSDDRCRTRLNMTRTTLDMNYSFLSLILSVFCDVLFIDSSFNLHHQLVVISLSVFLVTKKTNKGGTCSFFFSRGRCVMVCANTYHDVIPHSLYSLCSPSFSLRLFFLRFRALLTVVSRRMFLFLVEPCNQRSQTLT